MKKKIAYTLPLLMTLMNMEVRLACQTFLKRSPAKDKAKWSPRRVVVYLG